jgi:hypothetical protein
LLTGTRPGVDHAYGSGSQVLHLLGKPICWSAGLLIVGKQAANVMHAPEDGPIRNCCGWDPILDGDGDDSNSKQDLAMPDELQGKISDITQQMMDQ